MTAPRTVLLAISALHRGGAERQFVELVRGLDRDRWRPRVALCDPTDEYGVDLGAGPYIDLRSASGSTPLTGLRIAAALRRERPAVLPTFGGLLNLYGRLAVRATGIGRVVSAVRAGVPTPRDLRFERFTRGLTDALLVNSVGTRDVLASRARLDAAAIDVVPNGVDEARFHPLGDAERDATRRRLGLGGTALVVLARMSPEKNHVAVLRALGRLRRDGRLGDLHVHFVGRPASRADDETIRAAVTAEGLEATVRFAGPTDVPEDWLAAADGVVQASLFEGMSSVVLESMACGTPVLVSPPADRDGNVRDGVDGVRFTGTDPDEVAAGLARFLALPSEARRRLGESASRRARAEFSLAAMVSRTCAVWERVLRA